MIFFKVTSFFVVLVSVIAVSVADQNMNFGNPLGEVLGSIINTANNVVQNNPNSPNTMPTMPTTQIQPAPMHQVPIVPQAVPMHPAVAPSNTDHHPMHMLMNNLSVLAEQLHEQVQNAVASKNRSNVNQGIIIFYFILNMCLCPKCLTFCS